MRELIRALLLCIFVYFTFNINLGDETFKITWVKSPNFSSRGGKKISSIILHSTGNNDIKNVLSWLRSKESKVSVHYVIDKNGKIYQMVKDKDKAWHAGKSELYGIKDVNSISIGIELVSVGGDYTEEQYEVVVKLCKKLKKQYNIENKMIVGHNFVNPTKTDPEKFDWDKFFKLLDE